MTTWIVPVLPLAGVLLLPLELDDDVDDELLDELPHAARATIATSARIVLSSDLLFVRIASSSTEVVGPCAEIYGKWRTR